MRDECERRLESWEVCARARGVSSGISGCLGRDPSLAQPPNYTNWRCLSSGGRCGQQSFNDYGLGCGAYCGARASESWKFLKWRPRLICALIFSPISNHFPPLWESKSRRLVSPLWWRAVQKFGCWSRTTERESWAYSRSALINKSSFSSSLTSVHNQRGNCCARDRAAVREQMTATHRAVLIYYICSNVDEILSNTFSWKYSGSRKKRKKRIRFILPIKWRFFHFFRLFLD